jgi:hypothetical protein
VGGPDAQQLEEGRRAAGVRGRHAGPLRPAGQDMEILLQWLDDVDDLMAAIRLRLHWFF